MVVGIFPAAGGLGGSTYKHLLKFIPADQVVLISRNPDKVPREYSQAGAVLRQASYESSPEELEKVFAGMETLFLISYPSTVHDYRVKVQLPAVDAARRAGVKHIFYSSLGFASLKKSNSLAVVMQAHLDTERYLAKLASEDKSFTYTSIREGIYSESTPIYTASFSPENASHMKEILIPHDGSGPGVTWVKQDELGEASARLIADYVTKTHRLQYINDIVTLTGTRAWSLADTVDLVAKTLGKEVRIRQVSVDEYATQPQVLEKFGSREDALSWATAWDAIRAGETAVVTADMEKILGRTPEAFEVTIGSMWGQ